MLPKSSVLWTTCFLTRTRWDFGRFLLQPESSISKRLSLEGSCHSCVSCHVHMERCKTLLGPGKLRMKVFTAQDIFGGSACF